MTLVLLLFIEWYLQSIPQGKYMTYNSYKSQTSPHGPNWIACIVLMLQQNKSSKDTRGFCFVDRRIYKTIKTT